MRIASVILFPQDVDSGRSRSRSIGGAVAHMIWCGPMWSGSTAMLGSTGRNEIQQWRCNSFLN
jgi:hypothetical protein